MRYKNIYNNLMCIFFTFLLFGCSNNISSYIINFTHFTGKQFSMFAKSSQMHTPDIVYFNLDDNIKIHDLFRINKIEYKLINLDDLNFYMFYFNIGDFNYYFELNNYKDNDYKYGITSNKLRIFNDSFEMLSCFSFPYFLVDEYYSDTKEIDGETILFSTRETYSSFKKFFSSCGEHCYSFNDDENSIIFANQFKIIINNGLGCLFKS